MFKYKVESLRGILRKYAHDSITSDETCIAHKNACKRFINDLEKEGSESFPYVFDEKSAIKFLEWCRLFKHTKGVLAGTIVELSPIQVFVFSNIYGWLHQETRIRRFNKFYWQVGRKNAKSQSLSFVGSYECMAFGENMSEVYVGATKKDQSKIVFDEIHAQLKGAKYLNGKWVHSYGKITHHKSNSVIVALSKDSGKTGDGLNVQTGIVDEYHAHPTSEIYDVLVSGSGARKQPLMAIITTAGFNLDHPCYNVEYKYVKQILDPESPINNENYFVMINELDEGDDIKDRKTWIKANPILASYPEGLKYLENEMKVALDVPEKMRNFLTKNMNKWVDMKEDVLIPLSKWNACKGTFPALRGRDVYIGIDLSKKIDLSSVSFIFPIGDKFYIRNHSFIPKERLREKMATDRVPYDLWIEQGYMTATDGDVIDYNFIQAYIMKVVQQEGWIVKEVCFDPWSAHQFAMELEVDGYTIVEVPQNIKRMSEPTKAVRDITYQGNIVHDGNPVLTWSVGNAITKIDHNENIMLDKSKSTNRIDPLVSVIIGFSRAMTSQLESAQANRMNNHFRGEGYSM